MEFSGSRLLVMSNPWESWVHWPPLLRRSPQGRWFQTKYPLSNLCKVQSSNCADSSLVYTHCYRQRFPSSTPKDHPWEGLSSSTLKSLEVITVAARVEKEQMGIDVWNMQGWGIPRWQLTSGNFHIWKSLDWRLRKIMFTVQKFWLKQEYKFPFLVCAPPKLYYLEILYF